MAKFKACRVTYNGQRYFVAADGQVYPTWHNVATVPGGVDTWSLDAAVNAEMAKAIHAEAGRQRRNRSARERNDAMRSLGMRRTAYGWE